MDDNIQQQEDEVAVLQSIYDENVTLKGDGIIETSVNVSIPTPFSIIPPSLGSNNNNVNTQTSSDGYSVISLPPIILTTTHHPAYPSDEPPMFVISCSWLSSLQISILCRKLDEIWEESKGEVVIFRWITWLMEDTLPCLGINSPFILPTNNKLEDNNNNNDNYDNNDNLDSRAQSTCDPFTMDYLIDHDKQARKELFANSSHTCGICYCDYPGSHFIHQLNCDHAYCKDCMKQMCQIHINNGSIADIKCPEKSCRQQVLPQIVRQLVTDETMNEKYERLLLDRSLNSMDDVMWCPHCSTPVIIDDKLSLGSCTKCIFSFCTDCLQTWHPGTACGSNSKMLDAMKQRMSAAKKEQIEKMKQEMDSFSWVLDHTKMCPRCKTPIEKTEGCNKMTCFKCGSYFCWQCRNLITGYDHFKEGRCTLFVDTPLYNPDGQVANVHVQAFERNHHRRIYAHELQIFHQQRLMENNPHQVKRCPRCKNNVVKENNNNHIACWNCNSQFCYLCSDLIYGTAHFNKGKCKHHTND